MTTAFNYRDLAYKTFFCAKDQKLITSQ